MTDEQRKKFDGYAQMLIDWNRRLNLTAITDLAEIELKHFKDSLSASKYIPNGAKAADIGSGAGFPGLPLAVCRGDIRVTLIESLSKRAAFLMAVIGELGITNAEVITARAEELSKGAAHRERYDIATARAVAPINALSELCLPFVKIGGAFIALKGENAENELTGAGGLIAKLGGGEPRIYPADISEGINHKIIVIPKQEQTPENFPRRPSRLGARIS